MVLKMWAILRLDRFKSRQGKPGSWEAILSAPSIVNDESRGLSEVERLGALPSGSKSEYFLRQVTLDGRASPKRGTALWLVVGVPGDSDMPRSSDVSVAAVLDSREAAERLVRTLPAPTMWLALQTRSRFTEVDEFN